MKKNLSIVLALLLLLTACQALPDGDQSMASTPSSSGSITPPPSSVVPSSSSSAPTVPTTQPSVPPTTQPTVPAYDIYDGTLWYAGSRLCWRVKATGKLIAIADNVGRSDFPAGEVLLRIKSCKASSTELPVKLKLYQGLPKKDKMELIIQKAVELGAVEIIPVMTKRCIVKLEDDKKEAKKLERWQAIAESAAKQSGRGIIPKVSKVLPLKAAWESRSRAP